MNITQDVRIVPLIEAGGGIRLGAALDSIFYASSSVQTFPDAQTKADFRERWLGRYLGDDAVHAFVALDPANAVIGYVVGSLADPNLSNRFTDIAYFKAFAKHTADYPAHLHINVAEQARSHGIGRKLIEAFAAKAKVAGAPGVHVVTGHGMRNVAFYGSAGFRQIAAAGDPGKTVVMLGRTL